MKTFQQFIESREQQMQDVKNILTKLYYTKRVAPEDLAKMNIDELEILIGDMIPPEYPRGRFLAMVKHLGGSI